MNRSGFDKVLREYLKFLKILMKNHKYCGAL
jgi:hypothetical protein